ncbi:MAG: trimethylamine methyltransferase family protein, partial [Firmicutes bacterium]|nr:trimethylamine methyltransferase family protein [Bacillota bacterium]
MISDIQINYLNDEKIEKILDAAFTIMETTGEEIHYDKARDILAEAGCTVDGIRVKIPREVTKKCIESAPDCINIYDRNGNLAMELTGRNTYFGGGPTCPYFYDARTGERRPAKKGDAAVSALVTDALPNIDYAMSLVMVADETNVLADIHEVDAMVRNTTKPIASWAFNKENMEDLFHICDAVAGGAE